jgi:Zn-dependent alcohol dehydrogenase
VTIYGCGGVGLFAVQGARIASASQVIAVDPLESKRNAAAAAGATDLIDPTEGDPVEQVRALTSASPGLDDVGDEHTESVGTTRRDGDRHTRGRQR